MRAKLRIDVFFLQVPRRGPKATLLYMLQFTHKQRELLDTR